MQRGVARVGVWVAVTAAAVALSWFAVRTVLRDTVFEAPRAPALGAQAVEGRGPVLVSAPATISATSFASRTPSPRPSGTTPAAATRAASPTAAATTAAPASSDAAAPPDQGSGSTRSFEVKGGRASFSFAPDSASLIAATPNSGWAVKVWPGDRWIRVDFTRGDRTSSIFVTWNDHPPLGETYEA
ncbi:hypothetical protein [Yinghuangia soli]|uniref:Secreted protein n=1 Tax=Yinghuangia soli TaxID=2908204 RepID=A0AA41U1Z0_9ACTN|nr:hypothetical protein [Yinghuangia soli]MCF2528047.1 hypothetical protein [Yinghuangia soli]